MHKKGCKEIRVLPTPFWEALKNIGQKKGRGKFEFYLPPFGKPSRIIGQKSVEEILHVLDAYARAAESTACRYSSEQEAQI